MRLLLYIKYTNDSTHNLSYLKVRQIKVIGLGRIFCREGVYLVDSGDDAECLAPLADGKTGLLHLHSTFETYGTAYLEVGEAVDLGGSQ